MATIITPGAAASRPVRIAAPDTYPPASSRFEWVNAVLSVFWLGGLYLDGWAHNHGKVDTSFFTPWHAVLYGTYLLLGLSLTLSMMANLRKGYGLRQSLPLGYLLSFIGVTIFGFGGLFDLIWHTLFGIEANTEALLSPSHLVLATGGLLMVTGPVRAWAARPQGQQATNWRSMGPLIITVSGVLAVLTFFTQFTHPFLAANAANYGRETQSISAILIQTALMMGALLWLLQRWQLPIGAITFVLFSSAALITTFGDSYIVLPGVFLTCIVSEVLYRIIKPWVGLPGRLALFSFIVPALYYSAYFVTIQLRYGLRWSIHLWGGTVIMAGVVGFFLALMGGWPRPVAVPSSKE